MGVLIGENLDFEVEDRPLDFLGREWKIEAWIKISNGCP